MKVLVVILLVVCALSEAKRFFHGDQVLRLYPTEEQHFQSITILEENFPIDYWTDLHGIRPVDIHVPKKDLPRVKVFLRRNRVNFDVFIEDVQKAIANQVSDRALQFDLSGFDYNSYHTLAEIYAWTDNVIAEYPDLVSAEDFGSSYEGRLLRALKISKGGEGKPSFLINCGIHAREWITPASCMYAVKYLVEAKDGSEENNLLNQMDFYVIVSSNPDGYDYTWSDDRMWRKTRSLRDSGSICVGVDPNRNWDSNFGGEGSSNSPCSATYHGPVAFSEQETLLQRDFILSIKPKAYIDVHAYSELWMYPYGYTEKLSPDNDFLGKIADESAAAVFATHGKRYQAGPVGTTIYPASGITVDWAYDEGGVRCSYTSELRDTGRYGFLLPENQIQPTSEESFAGIKVIANYVVNGQC
ncbi:unnamed protein product [Clavelina lepadiformis]|uniref:Peptidase M14 domain-containing protein n=1 Tax=Clavelina lepadiformis TaxID=159417 RepID=A0ABP0EXP4_CLALP